MLDAREAVHGSKTGRSGPEAMQAQAVVPVGPAGGGVRRRCGQGAKLQWEKNGEIERKEMRKRRNREGTRKVSAKRKSSSENHLEK